MHKCEVVASTESGEGGGSLRLENKGAGEDVSADSDVAVASAAASSDTGILPVLSLALNFKSAALYMSLPMPTMYANVTNINICFIITSVYFSMTVIAWYMLLFNICVIRLCRRIAESTTYPSRQR